MKLIKYHQANIRDEKVVNGLVNSRIEYEVKGAQGRLEYTGPKLSSELWHQILSFFRWTNKEHQSECQVRLYVNVKLNRWAAWAFPQAARTGMTARELPVQESPEQARERFASWDSEPSDDWLYFGTAHHHCSASAFQSSTDEQNEWNQDGLHLTVGKMDGEHHDVHARFYLGGNAYEPDLSAFWPLASELREQVPSSLHHHLAVHQMGMKVMVDFPNPWRLNLVETKPEGLSPPALRNQAWSSEPLLPLAGIAEGQSSVSVRVNAALEEIYHECSYLSFSESEWLADLQMLAGNEVAQIILDACLRHHVSPGLLLETLAHCPMED